MELIDRTKLSVASIDATDLPQDEGLMVYLANDIDNAEVVKAVTVEELEEMRKEIVTSFISHTLMDAATVGMILKIIDKYMERVKK